MVTDRRSREGTGLLLALLAACAPDPAHPPSGPPPTLVFTRAAVVAEHDAWALLSTSAPAGAPVRVWWSDRTTTSCAPGVAGACLALNAPQVWGTGVVEAGGRAWVRRPAEAQTWGTLWLQADISVPGFPPLLSATFTASRFEARSDTDGDGLLAGAEVDARLNPGSRDTDNGGVGDWQELVFDLTDPSNAADDQPGERWCDNGVDDDLDGRPDCADPGCACLAEVCGDGVDNDADGLVDCEDAACFEQAGCAEQDCGDGLDDDQDGVIDCVDDDCWSVDCHDAVLAWAVAGVTRGSQVTSSFLPSGSYTHSVATAVMGRVRVEDSGAAQTCDWRVSRATRWAGFAPQLAPGGFTTYARVSEVARQGVWIDPACRVGPDILPASQNAWAAWYGPWTRVTTHPRTLSWSWPVVGPHLAWNAYGGPALAGAPLGTCANGKQPELAWVDADGDGYGVDGLDLHGRMGGRAWRCEALGPGFVAQGGDCDDGDPGINPVDVVLHAGRSCQQSRPWDLDADGSSAGVDADDHDGAVW